MASRFAAEFGAGELAYWVGLLHDLGKVNPRFQAYVRTQGDHLRHLSVPHAIWGAALCYELFWHRRGDAEVWKELALPIQGHHAGLGGPSLLAQHFEEFLSSHPDAVELMTTALHALPQPPKLPSLSVVDAAPTRRELRIRMVFSALVDADYLDTGRHFAPKQAAERGGWPARETLWHRLEAAQSALLAQAPPNLVNGVRRGVYEACLAAAAARPGVFRLTVPTGGGKTRSGLAFALSHAVKHDLRRVVVAIPYTSIVDQTAQVYREILGEGAIIEHHSQLVAADDESENASALRLRLAAENWDAPLIITTTVQLFESLLSNHPGRVRKLHNLARSVILLDEAQMLPPGLLRPTLDVLRALVEDYGVTLVLSTATQPAFEGDRPLDAFARLEVREIVPTYREHFQTVRRVAYERWAEQVSWKDLALQVRGLPQVMIVLNARPDALALLDAIGNISDVYHLSTLLCGAHRRAILSAIRARLAAGEPVRLISTQVVEAGVDLDFPVVFRAVGPLDRVVQAAGRCNREGRLPIGRVVIFEPSQGKAPGGPYKVGLEKARLLLQLHPAEALHEPDLYREYFRRLFRDVDLDSKRIQPLREMLDYPEVAARYRLIEDTTVPVVVPYRDGPARLADWLAAPDRATWQRLQPYLVGIYRHEVGSLERAGWLAPAGNALYRWLGRYDALRGVAEVEYDPSDLIV